MADIETWKTATFEERYGAMMAGMSEAEQKRSAEQVLHLCQCDRCPTSTGAGETNAVLCTLGKSGVNQRAKGMSVLRMFDD